MLQIERFALDTVRRLAPVVSVIGARDPDLARQLRRAASSIVLNIAEAQAGRDGNSRLRLRTALGSTRETLAALELAYVWGFAEREATLVDALDRISATLYKLGK